MRLRLCAMVGLLLVGILVFAGLRRGVSAAEERPPAIHDAEDPPAKEGGLLVAVIDTGVDAGHAGFHGRCLPGISLAEPDQPATDLAGHGTAVAGLIAGSTDDRSVAGTAAGSVRILPIKVTSGAERQTLPTFLAAGIDRAVAEGAGVICIAMGSPRSTRGLDEAIERARSKGVLIVAAAGISDGSADYWPAMHPWVISCTVTEQREAEQPDGTKAFVEVPAARAHISGKTELMGSGFAQSLAPGGGTARLEGSSVVTARVAGYVAKLRTIRPDLEAAEVRRRVILSAAPVELGNFSLNFPVRRVHDGIAAAWGTGRRDLCLEAFDTNPGPVEPGKPAKMELLIANLGSAEQDGEARVEFAAAGVQVRAAVKALKPGESRRVELDLPALKADSFLGRVSIRAEGDDNPANDALPVLLMVQPAPEVPVLVRHPRVIQLRYGEHDLVIAMEVQNCGPKQVRGSAGGAIGDVVTEQEITLDPRETKTIRTHMKIPVLAEGLTGVIPSVGFHVAGRPVHTLELPVNCVSPQATTQYADAWATKEIILDAPAFLVEGRVECPVLIFAPEAVSQDSQRKLSSSAAPFPGSSQRSRGLWLFEIHLEQAPFESVLKTDIVAGTPPSAMAGAKTLFHVRGRTEPPLLEGRTVESAGVGVESAVGMPVDPRDLVGFIREDGWHVVLNVPIASLANPADREIYLHAWVRSLDQALDPWKGGWTGFQSAVTIAEAVLRTQLHVSLPKFENSGQYYDLHVHTASEYTRDAVEPRLAWGGPLWMLVRSAHAMGFVDDAYLHAVRRQDLAAVGSREVLFTTDHNCFLTETVADPRTGARAEVKPAALPYGPELEIQTLRRFAGRGANQEVALQDPAGRPTGSAHALVYGVEPLRGPWHGGRRWQEGLGRAKVLLETLQAWRIPTFADRTLPGIIHWLLTQDASRGEVLGEINKALQKTGAPGITEEGFLGILRAWATFERGHLEELAALADGVISGAVARDERNDNTVPFVESQVAAHGAWIAAHPMAGGNLHWRIEDLDRAANLAGGPFVAIETAGRFPFSGVQIWNEEPFVEIPLGHPNELRQLNIWNRGIGTKQNFTNSHWHCEWMAGMVHYLNRLVLPGMSYTFQPRERRRRMFIRKLYHYAGSDAHGNFNYTTGVGATVLTNPDLAPLLAAFGQGHGSHTNTSHFGCARVYAQVPAFEEVYRGRVVCTDGPLAWIELDGDLKFDGASLIWHDRWDDPALAQDADGKIGGEGRFDGGRTALVRRDAAAAVLRYRVSERGPRSPRIERLDIHTLLASDDRASLELEPTAGAL
ncbi:MAG: S8 family serine peptidase, partial [Candidatus Brocadiae bacterium]|nr:S8 family serine peptidase [Candidatus Brocadiia bacterium]